MTIEISLDYRFCVESLADAQHARVMSDMMEGAPNPTSFECVQNGAPYSGQFKAKILGDVGFLELKCESPVGSNTLFIGERARSHIARNFSFGTHILIWMEGKTRMSACGNAHNMQAGNFAVMNTESAFSARSLDRLHVCNLVLPACWDRIGDTKLENVFGNVYSGHDQFHNGVSSFAHHLLSRQNALAFPDISEKLYDVVALALNPRAKSDHPAGMLALIRNYIDIHYTNADLDPATVARVFDISVRQLHRLFSTNNTSFTEYLIEMRLEKSRKMLADPRCRNLKILSIAFDCGFRNINHFGWRFRTRYGITPSEFRHATLSEI